MSIYGNLLMVGYDLTDIIFLCNCWCFCTYILFWNFISAYRESSGNRFYVLHDGRPLYYFIIPCIIVLKLNNCKGKFFIFFRIALGSVKFCPPYLQTHLEMKTSGEGGILKRYLL